jgi:hypothetical protein
MVQPAVAVPLLPLIVVVDEQETPVQVTELAVPVGVMPSVPAIVAVNVRCWPLRAPLTVTVGVALTMETVNCCTGVLVPAVLVAKMQSL